MGFQPAWFAEVDPFCSGLLAHHYPHVTNRGDFTRIAQDGTAVDVLVGGTPCQSFSVAGRRAGLEDARGNLAIEFCRLAGRLRPRWIVWENVPGVLSSNGGRDFGSIIGALAELGYGCAWRVLDAQFLGVPQRRRRVFVVGHFGDWRRAAAVLLEREGLCRDTPARRKTREGVAALTADGVGTCGADDNQAQAGHLIAFGGNNTGGLIDVAAACNAHGGAGRMDFETETFCVQVAAFQNSGRVFWGENERAQTLGTQARAIYEGNVAVVGTPPVAFSCKDHGADAMEDIAPTMRAMGHTDSHPNAGGQLAVAFESRFTRNGRGAPDVVAPPLKAQSGMSGRGDAAPLLATRMAVRRLTVRECERLQGLPTITR